MNESLVRLAVKPQTHHGAKNSTSAKSVSFNAESNVSSVKSRTSLSSARANPANRSTVNNFQTAMMKVKLGCESIGPKAGDLLILTTCEPACVQRFLLVERGLAIVIQSNAPRDLVRHSPSRCPGFLFPGPGADAGHS